MTRTKDSGVILVNVLVALALGSALVVLMLTSQDDLIDRSRRAAALAQAQALAMGGETSVLIALRGDMQTAPETDHLAEPWALIQQVEVEVGAGRFSVSIHDAQSGIDLNGLGAGGIAQQQVLARLVADLDLPPQTVTQIVNAMAHAGALRSLADIAELDPGTRAALDPHVSFLPDGGAVNLNTADAVVMGAVLRNRGAANRLITLRGKVGFLTPADLRDLGLVGTNGAGFKSAVFDVTVTAQVDDVLVSLTSRIQRVQGLGWQDVRVIARRFGPDETADLPEVPAEF